MPGDWFDDLCKGQAKEPVGSAVKTEMIQDLVFIHSLFAECSKAGIRMNKKTVQAIKKSPANTIKSMLEGMTDTQEGLLIIIDLCIRFKVEEENIWLVLFETISEPSLLVDRLKPYKRIRGVCGSRAVQRNTYVLGSPAHHNVLGLRLQQPSHRLPRAKGP